MKPVNIIRLLFLLALPLSFATHGSASTLQGKVIEILDGERITVLSVNQPLKVKLIAISAPVGSQPFADVAKQHLTELVSGKYCQIHYTSVNQDGLITGRVVVSGLDAGSQMIRDGVAWYDKSEASNFTEPEREMYVGCEQAARKEARGLWTDPKAIAPWEFRIQESARRSAISQPQTLTAKSPGRGKQQLTNDELFRSMTGAGSTSDARDLGWKTLAPHPARFSVVVPKDTFEFATTIPIPSGGTAEFNYALGRRGTKAYMVVWGTGPIEGQADDRFSDDLANGLVFGLNRTTNAANQFEVKKQRAVRVGAYAGWQYRMSSPQVPGTIRVFSRRMGQVREVYVLVAVNGTEDDQQIQEFLGSFTIERH
jgi:endonuclease YncB( thermonuclease family)